MDSQTITVTLKLFAELKEIFGCDSIQLQLAQGANVDDLRQQLIHQNPACEALVQRSAFAVNSSFARDDEQLPSDAEVACIPPVSGG